MSMEKILIQTIKNTLQETTRGLETVSHKMFHFRITSVYIYIYINLYIVRTPRHTHQKEQQ